MNTIEVRGPSGRIIESTDLSTVEPYNDPNCKHERFYEVDDDMEGVIAYKCMVCPVGWLIKEKIKEKSK